MVAKLPISPQRNLPRNCLPQNGRHIQPTIEVWPVEGSRVDVTDGAVDDAELVAVWTEDAKVVDDADGAQFLIDDVAAVDGADLDVGDGRVAVAVGVEVAALEARAGLPPRHAHRLFGEDVVGGVGRRLQRRARVPLPRRQEAPRLAQRVVQRVVGLEEEIARRGHDAVDLGELPRRRVDVELRRDLVRAARVRHEHLGEGGALRCVERRPPVVDAQGPAQRAVGNGHRRQVLPLRGVGREHRPQPAHLPGALRHDVYRSVTALSESRSQAPEARRTSPNARARHEVIMLAKQRMRSSSTYLPTFVPSLEEITC